MFGGGGIALPEKTGVFHSISTNGADISKHIVAALQPAARGHLQHVPDLRADVGDVVEILGVAMGRKIIFLQAALLSIDTP